MTFLKSIPLPRGPWWYLVAYRWIVVAAGIASVGLTWNLWQVRTGADAELAPMLPVADWLPQIDLAWWVVGSLLLILVRPLAGIILYSAIVVLGMLLDQTRIQYFHQIAFLLWATLPNINAQMIGRANLIAMWFWAGLHKALTESFRTGVGPVLLTKFVSADFATRTDLLNTLGYWLGWGIALTEMSLAILSLIPRTRRIAACLALPVHLGIYASLFWIGGGLTSNVGPWNLALALSGFALIAPWRESLWTSLRQCNIAGRLGVVFLLVYPAGYYANLTTAYLSHCIYVSNSPHGFLFRAGEDPRPITYFGFRIVNVPLPPGQGIAEQYFNAVRKPGDMLVIDDPRAWAAKAGMNLRQLTDWGQFYDGMKQGRWTYRWPDGAKNAEGDYLRDQKQGLWTSWHPGGQMASQGLMVDDQPDGRWIRWHANGQKQSEGEYRRGREQGHWNFWYDDGRKEMEGNFVDGEMDGPWTTWTPDGEATEIEFRPGLAQPATPEAAVDQPEASSAAADEGDPPSDHPAQ